jgi:hypothetical protein
MDPDPDVEADLAGSAADRVPTTDGTGRAVEGGAHAFAGESLFVPWPARLGLSPPRARREDGRRSRLVA